MIELNTKFLVTGVHGQLGYDVCKELKNRGYTNVVGIDVNELNIPDEKQYMNILTTINQISLCIMLLGQQ